MSILKECKAFLDKKNFFTKNEFRDFIRDISLGLEKKVKKPFPNKNGSQDGFTFVELAIVVAIIGLFLGMSFSKGMELLEKSRLQKVQIEASELMQNILIFREQHSDTFDKENASEDMRDESRIFSSVWPHMEEAGLISSLKKRQNQMVCPKSCTSGFFSLVQYTQGPLSGLWLVLGADSPDKAAEDALFTRKQANALANAMGEAVKILPGKNTGGCTDPHSKKKECIVYFLVAP